MYNEENIDRLNQILESVEVIELRCKDIAELDELLSSPWGMTVLDACVMRLQVIGETIKSLDDKTEGQLLAGYSQIPWKKIIGLRNLISHEYANIDYEIIWVVITKHLSPLKETIIRIIADLSANPERSE